MDNDIIWYVSPDALKQRWPLKHNIMVSDGDAFDTDRLFDIVNNRKSRMLSKQTQRRLYAKYLVKKYWGSADGKSNVSPMDVLYENDKNNSDFQRIVAAETKYPLLMRTDLGSSPVLNDGFHRLARAFQQGDTDPVRLRAIYLNRDDLKPALLATYYGDRNKKSTAAAIYEAMDKVKSKK